MMKPPTKLLLIENSIGLSGSTVSLCTLVSHLDRQRYAPIVVFSRPEQEAYFAASDRAETPHVTIRCRPSLRSQKVTGRLLQFCRRHSRRWGQAASVLVSALDTALVTLPYVARLYVLARKHRVRLIHQNNGFDVAAVFLARLLRVPLIAYQRGDEWNSAFVRYLSRFVTRYIANSNATAQNLISLGVPTTKLDVLYPPVDFDAFNCRRPGRVTRLAVGAPEDAPCVGIVGTLLEWKGHRVFLQAMKRVTARIPNAHALIIGHVPDGDGRYYAELSDLVRELGLEKRVVFTGFRTDVPDLLQLLDVVVHASITPEPFGRVIAEAMAMKRAVIATRGGGPSEIIHDGHNGRLVKPGDAAELAEAIIELLLDRSLARHLSEQAHVMVSRRFSATAHASDVQNVYDRATALQTDQRDTRVSTVVRAS